VEAHRTRRDFLENSAAVAGGSRLCSIAGPEPMRSGPLLAAAPNPVKVVVWDEQQPAQRQAYENFLGNQIGAHLKAQSGFSVKSVNINDGKPSRVRVLRPDHPIVEGIPREFELPQTEMYDEPFHVPEPHLVILEERWATGEWFRSGSIWKLGKGRVFYFRPGHETFPIYKQPFPLKIVANAVRWLASAG
jgi:type 1 glutamine amidotransferase